MVENRKRALRACDNCRRLKERCDGGVPCKKCSHSGRACQFQASAGRSRSRDFRPYVPRPQVVQANIQELVQRSRYMEQILRHTIEGIALDTQSLAQLAEDLGHGRANDTITASEPNEADDGVQIEEECTLDPVGTTTTHFSGEFSYWNFSMRIKQQIEDQMHSSEVPTDEFVRISGYWRAQQLDASHDHMSTAIRSCPPEKIAIFLATVFFKYTESYHPIVKKEWIFDHIMILYTDSARLYERGGEVTIAILLTVFAIGAQYAHLESSESVNHRASDSSEEKIGATFYRNAVRLLPEIIEISSLESVQACLLFGLYALPVDASGLGYIYINLSLRLAMQNGMHRKCHENAFSPGMAETRNRVWWTAYALERKVSIFHGRPLSVARSDVDAELPKCEAGHEGRPLRHVARAIASLQLVYFLEDFFIQITRLRHCPKEQRAHVLAGLLTRRDDLSRWWVNASDAMRNEAETLLPTENRSVMHLKLEYCLVRMFVGRPFMLEWVRAHTPTVSAEGSPGVDPALSEPQGERPKGQNSGRETLTVDCIQAAREALSVCGHLRDQGAGLARASYIEYSSCRASLLVLIAYSIQNPSINYRGDISGGLDMIREMSAAGESARSEVALIEALEHALVRLQERAGAFNPRFDPSEPPSRTSDYEAFLEWGRTGKTSVRTMAPPERRLPHQLRDQVTGSTHVTQELSITDAGPSNELTMSNMDAAFPATHFGLDSLSNLEPVPNISYNPDDSISAYLGWPTFTETQVLEQFLIDKGDWVEHNAT